MRPRALSAAALPLLIAVADSFAVPYRVVSRQSHCFRI